MQEPLVSHNTQHSIHLYRLFMVKDNLLLFHLLQLLIYIYLLFKFVCRSNLLLSQLYNNNQSRGK
ncbi:hypothetical protein PROFUN_14552 [Planoprotostelium fungivorum]|uniref:Uncharacterized protein n=1 Tax=Planoprotostelium fungivorum TaxID=1890364 RepID=A0A2P6MZL4_9EUKA|nr:hypothetical protein PROFUN_14552 [Planoprotostelium fungivorum]